MSEWLLPAAVAVASLTLTYIFCVRPMRNGHCATGGASTATASNGDIQQLELALEQARAELSRFRLEQTEAASDDRSNRQSLKGIQQ